MDRRSALLGLAAVSAGSLFARWDGARPQTRRSADDLGASTFRSDVRLVLLDVSVKDKQGNLVSGLSKDNFRVFEDGRTQPITVFAHDDQPVTVGILVDESRSMTPKHNQALTAALTFISESNRRDEIFILHFNDTIKLGLPRAQLFSDDIDELRSALFRGVPQGKTALNDAVVAGLKQLELGQRDERTLILISDGGDNASKHSRRETLDAVEGGIATIYTIGLFDPDDPDRDPSILQRLARISGGEAYFPASASEMVPVCRRIATDIRARYSVGYRPPADKKSLRHILLRVSMPGHGALIARTRESYRYEEVENRKRN